MYTWNVGLMLTGTIVMTLILATTFCLHLYFTTNVVDLLDIVVLIAIIGMIVDFPVHMLSYFIKQREAMHVLRKHQTRLIDEAIANDKEIGIGISAEDWIVSPHSPQNSGSHAHTVTNDPEPDKNARHARMSSMERTREALDMLKNEQPHVLTSFEEDARVMTMDADDHHSKNMRTSESTPQLPITQGNVGLESFFTSEEMYHSGMSREQLHDLSIRLSLQSNHGEELKNSETIGGTGDHDNHEPANSMAYALFAPLVTSVLVAVPLLFATLELLKKTGEYIIIMAIVSYFVTCFVCPWLLALTCRSNMLTNTLSQFIKKRWHQTADVTHTFTESIRRLSESAEAAVVGSGSTIDGAAIIDNDVSRQAEMLMPLMDHCADADADAASDSASALIMHCDPPSMPADEMSSIVQPHAAVQDVEVLPSPRESINEQS